MLDKLPKDIAIRILQMVSSNDRKQCAETCRDARDLTIDALNCCERAVRDAWVAAADDHSGLSQTRSIQHLSLAESIGKMIAAQRSDSLEHIRQPLTNLDKYKMIKECIGSLHKSFPISFLEQRSDRDALCDKLISLTQWQRTGGFPGSLLPQLLEKPYEKKMVCEFVNYPMFPVDGEIQKKEVLWGMTRENRSYLSFYTEEVDGFRSSAMDSDERPASWQIVLMGGKDVEKDNQPFYWAQRFSSMFLDTPIKVYQSKEAQEDMALTLLSGKTVDTSIRWIPNALPNESFKVRIKMR